MYYLYSDTEDNFYLAKSTNRDLLLKLVDKCEIKDWTIGDQPINYEEDEYYLVDEEFVNKSKDYIVNIFESLTQ